MPAFDHFSSLVRLTIPNSVTHTAEGAFNSCSSLVNMTIPDTVTPELCLEVCTSRVILARTQ